MAIACSFELIFCLSMVVFLLNAAQAKLQNKHSHYFVSLSHQMICVDLKGGKNIKSNGYNLLRVLAEMVNKVILFISVSAQKTCGLNYFLKINNLGLVIFVCLKK